MKCKAYGCCIRSDYASGYCHVHAYMVRANKIANRTVGKICNKKGCGNNARQGKSYCAVHDWSI